jgi:hypothetical protein
MFVVIACGEALEIVEQGIEEGGVELPQASCKKQYPRAGYAGESRRLPADRLYSDCADFLVQQRPNMSLGINDPP